MSRVTIKDIFWTLDSGRLDRDVIWDGCRNIEIVPRKMVEMIIERLKRNISSCENDSYADFTLTDVLQYAESLLKKFEED